MLMIKPMKAAVLLAGLGAAGAIAVTLTGARRCGPPPRKNQRSVRQPAQQSRKWVSPCWPTNSRSRREPCEFILSPVVNHYISYIQ